MITKKKAVAEAIKILKALQKLQDHANHLYVNMSDSGLKEDPVMAEMMNTLNDLICFDLEDVVAEGINNVSQSH